MAKLGRRKNRREKKGEVTKLRLPYGWRESEEWVPLLVEEPIVQLCPKMNSGSVVYNDWWTLETLAKDIPAIL